MHIHVARLALAPLDDEPFTEQDRLAVAEADEWCKHNDPTPLVTVLSDFALLWLTGIRWANRHRRTNTPAMPKAKTIARVRNRKETYQ